MVCGKGMLYCKLSSGLDVVVASEYTYVRSGRVEKVHAVDVVTRMIETLPCVGGRARQQ